MVKNRSSSKKREDILNAAAEAFVNEGYDNSSMDRIAETAGASKRTVYNHFSSKEELYNAVIDRFREELTELKQYRYNPSVSLEEQLSIFADVKISISTNPSWLGLMKVGVGVFFTHPEIGLESFKKLKHSDDAFITWLKDAVEDGKMRVEDYELTSKLFWAMVSGAFFWPSIFAGPMDSSEAVKTKGEIIKIFLAKYKV